MKTVTFHLFRQPLRKRIGRTFRALLAWLASPRF